MTRLWIILVLFAFPGNAQMPACMERSAVLAHLSNEWSEKPIAIGIANNGWVFEVLAAPRGKTWTIITTMPSGLTCMRAAGEDWQSIKPVRGEGT